MIKHLIYLIVGLATLLCTLASCGADDMVAAPTGTVVLQLTHSGMPAVATRAGVNRDLALVITRTDGRPFADGRKSIDYAAGQVPDKITLEVGRFNIHVFTDNQATWPTANGGLGEACYEGDVEFSVGDDDIVYCVYEVPMTNSAVAYSLPDRFDEFFTAHTFSVTSDGRSKTLAAGDTFFCSPQQGFVYTFSLTNADGETFKLPAMRCAATEAGLRYTVRFTYDDGLTPGSPLVEAQAY